MFYALSPWYYSDPVRSCMGLDVIIISHQALYSIIERDFITRTMLKRYHLDTEFITIVVTMI